MGIRKGLYFLYYWLALIKNGYLYETHAIGIECRMCVCVCMCENVYVSVN